MRRPTEHTVERVIRTYPTLATPSGERRNGTGMEDQGAPRVGLAADPQKLACPVLGAVNTTRQQTSLCSPVLGTTRGIHNTPTFLTLFTTTRFNRAEHNITLSVLRLWPLLGKDVKVRSNRIQVLALATKLDLQKKNTDFTANILNMNISTIMLAAPLLGNWCRDKLIGSLFVFPVGVVCQRPTT